MIFADTSVISALGRIKRIDLLKIFDDVLIPKGVFSEILESGDDALIKELKDSISTGVISVYNTDNLVHQTETFMKENKLGRGESEVLVLARVKSGNALIDDKNARKAGKKQKTTVYGTLTLLKFAHKKGVISRKELKNILDDVIEKGNLYVSEELYKWVLKD